MNKSIKKITAIAAAFSCAFFLNGCGLGDVLYDAVYKIPDNWYTETLEYYREGFDTGWQNEKESLRINDEMKDPNNKFGYLLKDLDGDGAEEVLIGIIDDSPETKFTDIYIWHRDRGAFRILSAGEDYYMYLCDDNVIKMDKWYGSKTLTDYMKYNSKDNAFTIISGGTNPGKYTLNEF